MRRGIPCVVATEVHGIAGDALGILVELSGIMVLQIPEEVVLWAVAYI